MYIYRPLSQKNLHNCALTSNGWNSSQGFLRCFSWVVIFNLARIKFSISFLDRLINFSFFLSFFFLAALGYHCCPQAFFSLSKRGYSSLWCVAFSFAVASLAAEHGL